MHEVFISYSTQDKTVADAICHRFEAGGIRCWYAPRDVAPGAIWQDALMKAIQTTKVFLLVYSKDYNNSMQVLNELTAAVKVGCLIVPFRIDQSNMNNAFAYYLNSVHWLDAINPPTEQQIENLYRHICNMLQKDPLPPPPPSSPPPPPKPPKKKSKWKWLFALVPVVLLLVGLLFAGLPGSNEASDPQKIPFLCLSDFESHYYPFYAMNAFSDENEMYCLVYSEEGTLTIARTDNGKPYLTGIENVFDDPTKAFLKMRDGRDTIYFFEFQPDNTLAVRFYSKSARDWLNKDGIKIPLLPEEYVHNTGYYSPTMLSAEDHSEEVGIYLYNDASDAQRLSRIIWIHPDGKTDELDIRQYDLQKVLSGIDDPSHRYGLFLSNTHELKILDYSTGKLINVTHQEILERFIPLTQDDLLWFSPDKRYLHTMEGDTAYIWDLSLGKLAFRRTFTGGFAVWFRNDTQIVFHNYAENSVSVYDLQNEKTLFTLEEEYFAQNPHFPTVPYSITYSPEYDVLCCVSCPEYDEETLESKEYVTIVDMDGNVLAVSDEIVTRNGMHFAEILVHDSMLFLTFSPVDASAQVPEDICTYVYRALYTTDENGNIQFSEDYF